MTASASGVRIVSLVPSLTELLCALGLREHLVGRTGFCIHPRESLRDVPKVGGTKDVDVDRVRSLAPTHVVVNVDENDKPVVDRIARFVPHVVVTHPVSVDDNLALIERFGEIFGCRDAARVLGERHRDAARALHARSVDPLPVLYLIWKKPWMSVGRDTFIANMLAAAGLQSVVAAGEPRYPVLDDEAIRASGARAVLLSSEPYRFTERHRQALQRELDEAWHERAGPGSRAPTCATIDGEMTSWYGSRAIDGMRYLREYRDRLERTLARSHVPE